MQHPSFDELPDILTFKEVQLYLRVGRDSLYSALQSGKIRSARIGQRFIIPKEAVRDFLNGVE